MKKGPPKNDAKNEVETVTAARLILADFGWVVAPFSAVAGGKGGVKISDISE